MTRGLQAVAGRRLLLLNWRDLSHPRAGGAEVYCHELGERLVRAGADVTLFTAHHQGAPLAELRGGIRIVREGGQFGVYARAAAHLRQERHAYDGVIDFQNGIPFFAPLFVGRRTAVVCVVHHVHQEQFALHFPWPASRVGQLLEGPGSRLVYGHRPVVAVSPSTRRDVRRRLRLRGPIHVVPNGLVTPSEPARRVRTEWPSIAVVSRLVAHKRFDLLVDELPALLETWPDLRVDVAGDGPEREPLMRRAAQLGVERAIRFHGFVSAEQREDLLASAWLTVSPSQAEGWGLTVVEANSAGVPAVAFDVPGLRDSIVDGETGWLIPPGGRLADGVDRALRELSDAPGAGAYSQRCQAWAQRFSWDASAERLAAIVAGEIDRVQRLPRSRRAPSDLGVRVDAPLIADKTLAELSGALRRSDQCSVDGDELRLLLHGCDESGAEQVLRRLGITEVHRMGLATTTDLLVGAA